MAAKSTLRLLGEELRAQRRTRGLTQDVLAAKAGLHRNFIGMIERGERNVTILTLEAVTDVLKIAMSDVLSAVERRKK